MSPLRRAEKGDEIVNLKGKGKSRTQDILCFKLREAGYPAGRKPPR